ncbi:MAG: hypothetical protein D6689_08110 [Deltaproteobacteria bacterium]|nr:MAG: hypothetical protein D6689_08110 [Deltaproteobacteria bacterium]
MQFRRILLAPGFLLALAASPLTAGCGLQPTGTLPVDSQLKPWEPPDEDELVEGDDLDDLDAADGDDAGAPDRDDGAAATPAPAGAAAPAPAGQPAQPEEGGH